LTHFHIHVAYISIGVDYLQVLQIFAFSKGVNWPESLRDTFAVLRAFALSVDIAKPECALPDMPYELKWFAVMAVPLVALVVILVAGGGQYCYERFYKGHAHHSERETNVSLGQLDLSTSVNRRPYSTLYIFTLYLYSIIHHPIVLFT
jgi:hypothetical protein